MQLFFFLSLAFVGCVYTWPDAPCRTPPLAVNYTIEQVCVQDYRSLILPIFSMLVDGLKLAKYKLQVEPFLKKIVSVHILTFILLLLIHHSLTYPTFATNILPKVNYSSETKH